MKKRDPKDLVAAALCAGVGGLAYMIYKIGKSAGQIEAYGDCRNMLEDLVKVCQDINPEK